MSNERACANEEELPDGVMDRVREFATATGTTPPSRITEGTGEYRTFSSEFRGYCRDNVCSLDWVWIGDEAVTPEAVYQARATKRETRSDTAQEIIDAVMSLDEVEQMIFTYCLRALSRRAITADDFVVRFSSLVARHRSGGGVTVGELESALKAEAH